MRTARSGRTPKRTPSDARLGRDGTRRRATTGRRRRRDAMTGAASALRRCAHDGDGGVLNMDRLLSTVLLALTLVDRPYLLVDGADQPMSGSTHAPSLPQGKYDALSRRRPARCLPRTTNEHPHRRLLTISLSRPRGVAKT